jgi:cysteine desulfurase/selenocysteine lyase
VPGESFEFVPDFATSSLVSTPGAVPEFSPGSLYLVQDTPGAHGAEPDFSSLAPSAPAVGGQGTERQPPAIANPTAVPASAAPFVPGESFEFAPELVPELSSTARPFDPRSIRRDFPILQEKVNGRPLIWLDNAATTQKPQAVIDRLSEFYEHENSNIHRAAHALAARATDAYEAAREKVRRFINAPSDREIVFVRGTTEGVNLVAKSWGGRNIEKGDEIVITWLEHHANIVPWQQLCSEKGARLRVAPVDDKGQIILEEYEKLFNSHTKIVSFSQVSNALGTITPAREMIEIAHRHGALVLLDGAQAVSHMRVDVQLLDCDFFVFSGHKVFGPTGIGAVFGKTAVLDSMPPWQGGGNMIADVTFEKTVYNPPPWRFEAGTGNIADAVGLGAALDYVTKLGMENIERYEHELLVYATERLLTVPGLTIIGTAAEKAGVISFVLDGFRTEDVGAALDREGIAVRAGHHCAQPILRRFGLESTVRPSLAPYNTCEDIDVMVTTLRQLQANSGHRGL